MDIKESINDTRKVFEESFATGDFYNRQTLHFYEKAEYNSSDKTAFIQWIGMQ